MITKKIAPALAAGCSIVLKPSEETPMTAIKIRELALQAGIPKEVFGIVYGDYKEIGRALLESKNIKMISFTGSVDVGKHLMKHAASTVKKVVLELGGNAPCIVFKEANLELSVEKIIQGKFRNAGQACTAPNRIFVEESILDEFKALLIEKLSQKDLYNIGPLINHKAKEKTNNLIKSALDAGAKILYRQDNINREVSNLYFSPLVIVDLKDDMDIVKEEVFAPVFSILSFKDTEEVIDRSNNTQYGLAAYIFSSDLKKALYVAQKLNFGVFGINEASTAADLTIHGGFNESGLGREGGKIGLMEYLENKFIVF
jgi:succinate-semialdehyde dehydrogenase/glutarate-semialdehyde dehydrogenase